MYEKNYINGEWVAPHSSEFTEVTNPTTLEVIGQVPHSDETDVDQAVAAAKDAFPAWNTLPVSERADYIRKILEGIKERQQAFADIIVEEFGTSKQYAEESHVPLTIKEMESFLELVEDYEFEEQINNYTLIKEGFGVVACITPWNYPLNQIQRKIVPALLAGNTVVVKPASITPLTAMLLVEVIHEAKLPAGVFNLITGGGSTTGDYLAGHPDVAVISFTGSTEVGKGLYEKAGPQIKKLVLELGGKSPLIYLEGGDLESAVQQAMDTVLHNQGQTCSALTRLIVPESHLEKAEKIALDYYDEVVKVGDPTQDDTMVGPMSSKDQYETVMDYLAKGKEAGAKVLIGGDKADVDLPGYFVQPTIFSEVSNDMVIAQEEIFGPVLCILTYKTVEEAIEIANDSLYGLSGAVVGPEEEAKEVARQLRTGNIYVNGGSRQPDAPFGGYKQSGLGRENGVYGLEDYLEIKAIFC